MRATPPTVLRLLGLRAGPLAIGAITVWIVRRPSRRAHSQALAAGAIGSALCARASNPWILGTIVSAAAHSPTRCRIAWPAQAFPANKKENRGAPALCVSGNFQGKQRVFGAQFWKLASFPESESWSGAKSEAKSRKPATSRAFSRYTWFFQVYPQNTRYFADLADFGPKPASDSAQSPEKLMVSPGKQRGKKRVL